MKLTIEEGKKVWERIKTLNPDLTCPVCKKGDFAIPENVFELLENDDKRYISVIPIICPKCGYTFIFNKSIVLDEKKTLN